MDYVYQNGELYLAHHGILGQKWGVRRFQNPDGSLTSEGRKRYLKDVGSTSYTLTDKGVKQYKKEYEKLYGKGSYEKTAKDLDKWERDNLDDMYWNQTSQLLKNVSILSDVEATSLGQKHVEMVKEGKLFTKEFFQTKYDSIKYRTLSKDAQKILNERQRLYDEAVKNDNYSIDYLEMTPDEHAEWTEKQKLADYKKWLDDPKTWREKRYKK